MPALSAFALAAMANPAMAQDNIHILGQISANQPQPTTDGDEVTLAATIAQASLYAPSQAMAGAALAQAQSGLENARAQGGGQILANGEWAYGQNDFGAGAERLTGAQISIGYEHPLFDGGATSANIAAAHANVAASMAQQEWAKVQLAQMVAIGWQDLALAQSNLEYGAAELAAMARYQQDATALFAAGEVARSVVEQANAYHAAALAYLAASQFQADQASARLRHLTGQTITHASLDQLMVAIPLNIDEARPLLASHPLFRASNEAANAASHQVSVANGRSGPQSVVGVRAIQMRNGFMPNYQRDATEAYVRVSVPLWDGGQARSAAASINAQARGAQAAFAETRSSLEENLSVAYAGLSAAQANLAARRAARSAASAGLNSIAAEFAAGERPMIDLLKARADFARAQSAEAAARGQFLLAHWHINTALGRTSAP